MQKPFLRWQMDKKELVCNAITLYAFFLRKTKMQG